ncbi:MAG: hypothetical protein WKF86_07760 [Acidimicrobiales bacterium]
MKPTRSAKLFTGHDQGHYTLPKEVLDPRRRLATYSAATDWPVDPWPAAHAALLDQVRAVADGGPPPDINDAVAARAANDILAGTLPMLRRQVAEELAEEVDLAVADLAGEILTSHLRPALDEVLATVSTAAKAAPVEVLTATDSMLLSAKDSVRKAAIAIDCAAFRYHALRGAHGCVRQLVPAARQDERGSFGELRRMEVAWPTHRGYTPAAQRPPWEGMTPRARLLFIVTTGAEPWLPTAEEQDARFMEVYGADIAAALEGRRQAQALAGVFGR